MMIIKWIWQGTHNYYQGCLGHIELRAFNKKQSRKGRNIIKFDEWFMKWLMFLACNKENKVFESLVKKCDFNCVIKLWEMT